MHFLLEFEVRSLCLVRFVTDFVYDRTGQHLSIPLSSWYYHPFPITFYSDMGWIEAGYISCPSS